MRGYEMNKDDYLTRLRRVEGQVRGLQRMIDEDTYCIQETADARRRPVAGIDTDPRPSRGEVPGTPYGGMTQRSPPSQRSRWACRPARSVPAARYAMWPSGRIR